MALHTLTHSTHTHTGTCTPTCIQLNTPSQSCSVSCQANVLNENFLTKITSINQLTCKQHTCRHTHAHTHTYTVRERCLSYIPVRTLACVLCPVSSHCYRKLCTCLQHLICKMESQNLSKVAASLSLSISLRFTLSFSHIL